MRRVRVIPILLLTPDGLVKTVRFKNPTYIGDPINAVKIFNEKEVDELAILSIDNTLNDKQPDYAHISDIVSEAFMPLSYGGGIQSADHIRKVIDCGIEKVVLNTASYTMPKIIEKGASIYGSQSVVASVDVVLNWMKKPIVKVRSGRQTIKYSLIEYIAKLQDFGVGEILLTSIDREGTFRGYDLKLIEYVSSECHVPLVANGGASCIKDFVDAIKAGASAVAAGSRFIYSGNEKGVLINYPPQEVLEDELFNKL